MAAPPPAAYPEDEKAAEPETPPQRELTPAEKAAHIEDALHELDDAERALKRSFEKKKRTEKPTPGEAVPPPTPVDAPDCVTACSALRSMTRSAGYVCRLAGEGDARCARAKERVTGAEKRIATARCSCPEATTRWGFDDAAAACVASRRGSPRG